MTHAQVRRDWRRSSQQNFEMYINLKTAKALCITVPLPLSGRANEVFEWGGACPLLAQSGHPRRAQQCPLSGVKRTLAGLSGMSASDPKAAQTAPA